MRKLKEVALFMAAELLQEVSQRLFMAAFREHVKTCPHHKHGVSEATNYKVN